MNFPLSLGVYARACSFKVPIIEESVEEALGRYLLSLNVKRNVVRIRRGWKLDDAYMEPAVRLAREVIVRALPRISFKEANNAKYDSVVRDSSDGDSAILDRSIDKITLSDSVKLARDTREHSHAYTAHFARHERDSRIDLHTDAGRWNGGHILNIARRILEKYNEKNSREATLARRDCPSNEAYGSPKANEAKDIRYWNDTFKAGVAIMSRDDRVNISLRNSHAKLESDYAQEAAKHLNDPRVRHLMGGGERHAAGRLRRGSSSQRAYEAIFRRDADNAIGFRGDPDNPADCSIEEGVHSWVSWCLWRSGWYSWDLSWLSTIAFGAESYGNQKVLSWSKPLYDAFCSGAWGIIWVKDTLYWVAHPCVYSDERGRPHRETGPAIENDLEDLFFINGTLLPPYVVTNPDSITVKEVDAEMNIEKRRIMIERMGIMRYLRESGARTIHMDSLTIEGSAPRALIEDKWGNRWLAGTDGSTKRVYFMPVPRAVETCSEAHNEISGFDEAKLIGEA